ncbi:hypothetical protein XENOCAPTIV_007735 [Xenoophorus captivus]|uniref:Uncharacterized protein n=1 Tax=Xenoophorus captivus TaxID=1517983 RepID=A0ABV0RTK5_9TELE
MPKSPQLAPLDVEEQRLYSEPLPDGRAPHPISKGVPGHPTEEAHFSRLYPRSRSFSHDPKFMAIGEGRNVDPPSQYLPKYDLRNYAMRLMILLFSPELMLKK